MPSVTGPIGAWEPLMRASDLPDGRGMPCHVSGSSAVVYRLPDGRPRLVAASCPHLGTHLGYGSRVVRGALVCPEHQWRVEEGGQVAAPDGETRACLRTWRVREREGIIEAFTSGEEPPKLGTPAYPRGWYVAGDAPHGAALAEFQCLGRRLRCEGGVLRATGDRDPWPAAVVGPYLMMWSAPDRDAAWPPPPLPADDPYDRFVFSPIRVHPVQVGAQLADLARTGGLLGLEAMVAAERPRSSKPTWALDLTGRWRPAFGLPALDVHVSVVLHALSHARLTIRGDGFAQQLDLWCSPIDYTSSALRVCLFEEAPTTALGQAARSPLRWAMRRRARQAVEAWRGRWAHATWLTTPILGPGDEEVADHHRWATGLFADPRLGKG